VQDGDGGGKLNGAENAHDCAKKPLDPAAVWRQSPKTAVCIILTSRYAMFVWSGRELTNLYNDPYAPIIGKRHCAMEIPLTEEAEPAQ
jgi:hypothetical protein